jgi:hypothetical protein
VADVDASAGAVASRGICEAPAKQRRCGRWLQWRPDPLRCRLRPSRVGMLRPRPLMPLMCPNGGGEARVAMGGMAGDVDTGQRRLETLAGDMELSCACHRKDSA